jgi:endoglucanase
MNFGNILDAPSEGAWGLRLSDDLFDAARASGATTIRLPVRWSNHALATTPYTIDPNFFARVDYAVNAALSRGMRIVIDMHHHRQLDGDALDAGEFSVAPAVIGERFVAIWRQIATRYRDRPTTVLYELYNEPHGLQTAGGWNALLSMALDAVRAIDTTHYIVIGPVGWNSASQLDKLVLPATDHRLIVTVHSYEPFSFTHQGAAWAGLANSPTVTCCTPAQVGQIAAPLVAAHRWRDTWSRPIWVGEFGSYSHGPYDSRVTYTRTMRDSMEAHGLTWAYWEFASGFGIYDQPSRTWKADLRDALFR